MGSLSFHSVPWPIPLHNQMTGIRHACTPGVWRTIDFTNLWFYSYTGRTVGKVLVYFLPPITFSHRQPPKHSLKFLSIISSMTTNSKSHFPSPSLHHILWLSFRQRSHYPTLSDSGCSDRCPTRPPMQLMAVLIQMSHHRPQKNCFQWPVTSYLHRTSHSLLLSPTHRLSHLTNPTLSSQCG
jgi:hypothetical protein